MTFAVTGQSRSVWVPFEEVIPASTTLNVLGETASEYGFRKYIFSYFSVSNSLYTSVEIESRRKGDGTLLRSVHGRIGDSLNMKFIFVESAGSVYFRVQNNELFGVTVKGFYLKLT